MLTANGATVAVIRRFRLLSQRQLAALVGKSSGWIASVEKGRIPLSGDDLEDVAEALGVSAVALAAHGSPINAAEETA